MAGQNHRSGLIVVTSSANPTDVLILGASGRVGEALGRLLPGYGLSVRSVSRRRTTADIGGVDVCCEEELAACVEAVAPRVVIYAVAISDPDRCERDPSTSYDVNVTGPSRLASAAARLGSRLVYYSSDYVFGEPGRYFEDAPVAPLQVYGRHKSEAERRVLDHGDNVVIRLPLLFGSRDFVADAVNATIRGIPLRRDERRRYPIPVQHVAQVTAMIITTAARSGIYHAVGVDAVTKSEWACYIAGLLGRPVPPVAASVEPSSARRPVDVELATRLPEMCTEPGMLWTATRARVTELCGSSGGLAVDPGD